MEQKELFINPMILVSHETGNRYPAFKGWIAEVSDDLVRLKIMSGMQTGPFMFAEPDAVSIVDISEEKKRIQVTDENDLSYTIRPINDTDSEWLFNPLQIDLPADITEKAVEKIGESLMSEDAIQAGTPSVMAFTRGEEIETVALDISEVSTYFRVDGGWSLEMPIDIEDTDTIKIIPSKAADFVNRWDEKDGNLYEELDDYAVAEEE
jgi:hypothetical protein